MKRKSLYYLVLTALLAALTAALTTAPHLLNLPNGGYVHLGDLFVFLAGCLLPTPYAMAAAAIGGGLGDLFSGAAQFAPATILIKAAIAALFSANRDKLLTGRNALMTLPAAAITMGGYLLYEGIAIGWHVALTNLPFNLLQAASSAALFFVAAAAMDKTGLKRKIQ